MPRKLTKYLLLIYLLISWCSKPRSTSSLLYHLQNFAMLLIRCPLHLQRSPECVGHQNFMRPLWKLSIGLVVVNMLLQRVSKISWMLKAWPYIMLKATCRCWKILHFFFNLLPFGSQVFVALNHLRFFFSFRNIEQQDTNQSQHQKVMMVASIFLFLVFHRHVWLICKGYK